MSVDHTLNSSSPDPDRAGDLIARYLEDDLDRDDELCLRRLMESDPAVRRQFVDVAVQTCAISRLLQRDREGLAADRALAEDPLMEAIFGQAIQPPTANSEEVSPTTVWTPQRTATEERRRILNARWAASIAAVIATGLILTAVIWRQKTTQSALFARLTRQVDAVWNGPAPVLNATLTGPLSLRAGLAEVQFAGGATIILEGPADLQIDSDVASALKMGKMTANVPGGGFVVHTPSMDVKDLGTEFGVAVGPAGVSHVEVFKGSVQAAQVGKGTPAIVLVAGQGAATTGKKSDGLQAAAPQPLAFVRADRFAALASADVTPEARWRSFEADLLRDPALVLYYNFDDPSGPDLAFANRATGSTGNYNLLPAENAATLAPGRWLHDRAANFSAVDRQGLLLQQAPIKTGPMTVCAWVFARTRTSRGSIVKNWGAVKHGQFHFGLRPSDGVLEVQIRQENKADVSVNDDATPFPVGKWVHVAFVADGRSLRLYRDGQVIGSILCGPPVVNAAVQWMTVGYKADDKGAKPSIADGAAGHWDGRIDDLALFSRALSAEEIRELHTRSKPQP